jgi:DNA-binding CsgD family transcriptional regulator
MVALAGTAGTAWQLRQAHLANLYLQYDLEGTRADLTRWRTDAQDLMRGLGRAIDQQFVEWGLSANEREVALLILRGLSYKDIASARETSERTARVQALAVYRKAGVSGRAEMAAFFLEDLLLPRSVISVPVAPDAGSGSLARVISLASREELVTLVTSDVTADGGN